MINHIRTLLLNLASTSRLVDYPADAYIPESYIPIDLSGSLLRIYQALMGTDSDDLFKIVRTNQLLHVLDSTEYKTYKTNYDERITYNLLASFLQYNYGTLVILKTGNHDITVVQRNDETVNSNVLRVIMDVSVVGTDTVAVYDRRTGRITAVEGITVTNGLSDPIPLGYGLYGNIYTDQLALTPGDKWEIESVIRPADDVSQVVTNLEKIGDGDLSDLWVGDNPDLVAFSELWHNHNIPAYRLAGVLWPYINRLEEIRIQNG